MEENSAKGAEKKKTIDVWGNKSQLRGFAGWLESFFKTFRTLGFIGALIPISAIYIICWTLAIYPGVMLFHQFYEWTEHSPFFVKTLAQAFALALGYVCYGFSLLFLAPLFNKLMPWKVRPQRASWFSFSVLPWYYHNALTYIVRYTFLDFLTPSPLNKLFYQMMGMKIGKGSMINTSNISDPCLIEIGEYVTIGGSATLMAHYGMKGLLVIDRLVIKDAATIGLKASVFGDVIIGKGALIKPGDVVLPKSRIPDKETYSNRHSEQVA
jgi:hypothetical protein